MPSRRALYLVGFSLFLYCSVFQQHNSIQPLVSAFTLPVIPVQKGRVRVEYNPRSSACYYEYSKRRRRRIRKSGSTIDPRKSPSPTSLSVVNLNHEAIFNDLDNMYTDASKTIKCPFFRRRVADFIDNIAMILKFLIIRHKSILLNTSSNANYPYDQYIIEEVLEVPGCKALTDGIRNPDGSIYKNKHLSMQTIQSTIESDWSTKNDKGYYITGKLTSTIYRDDCYFDGPDPDMPVRGLRKYLAAASHLFESKNSFAKLHKLQIEEELVIGEEGEGKGGGGRFGHGVIIAYWTIGGVLMLPWRPKVKPWSGWTRYHIDEDGLIGYHEESWEISALEAFIGTMFPEIGDRIWERDVDKELLPDC